MLASLASQRKDDDGVAGGWCSAEIDVVSSGGGEARCSGWLVGVELAILEGGEGVAMMSYYAGR